MIYLTVVSFALGILSGELFGAGRPFFIFIILISLSVFLILKNEKGRMILLCSLFFAAGILRMDLANTSPDRNLTNLVGEKNNFEAIITDEPDIRDNSVRYTAKILDSKGYVLLVADRFPELRYGDKISVSGKLQLPKNFDQFDYVSYLSKDNIHFLIYYPEIVKLSESNGNKLKYFLYSLKNIFIQKISNVVPEPDSSLLGGLIFGAKQSLGQDLLDDFRNVGLIHIVVLSGYNITVIAAGVFSFFSMFGKRNLSFTASAISISLFAVMVGLGATVIRASIMALIAILARFLGRPADALRWLFIAGFLMLIYNPLSFYRDPSFQLSFMATLGLVLFSPIIENFIIKSRFSKLITPKFKIREIVSSTLAVQIFVLPLLIKMSGQFSLVSFLANPVVLPLVPWAMLLGGLTGGIGLLPFVGQILSWPAGIIAYILSRAIILPTEIFSKIPLASIPIGTLPVLAVLIWYAFYILFYLKLKRHESF